MSTYQNSKKPLPFTGASTALVTPFAGGKPDISAFCSLVSWQTDMGIDSVTVAGTTGEAATLSITERRELTRAAADTVRGQIPVIAGCGSADTATACRLCQYAVQDGADALLVITPYCNKGTELGIIEHFKKIADAADGKPIIIYNVPARTGVDLTKKQYIELCKIENICAVKEASESMGKVAFICSETELSVYSGNDGMTLPVISLGGRGVISVLSNLVPSAVSKMSELAVAGIDMPSATEYALLYSSLTSLLFAETNPAPVKYAMAEMGLIKSDEMRLPMHKITDELKEKISVELKKLSLI